MHRLKGIYLNAELNPPLSAPSSLASGIAAIVALTLASAVRAQMLDPWLKKNESMAKTPASK